MDEELDFNFGGDTTPDEEKNEPTTDEVAENTNEENAQEDETEVVDEEKKETDEPDEEEPVKETQKQDNKVKALDAERARRKQAEKELKELKAQIDAEKIRKEDEARLEKERENLKKELLNEDLIDEEVADKLINTFGNRLLKSQIENERKTAEEDFDKQFSKLVSEDFYKDAEAYKPEIKELMAKGLTMEQAYRAAIPQGRFEQMRKDMEIEAEQKLLYSQEKAEKVDIGHAESKSEVKRTNYTKREQEIAHETGLDIKDVHKRSKIFTLDEMLDL